MARSRIPSRTVGSGASRIDCIFVEGEVFHKARYPFFCRERQNALNLLQGRWDAILHVAHKRLDGASRTFLEPVPLPRVISRWLRKFTTKGASICSRCNRDGGILRRSLAYTKSSLKA